MSNTTKTTTKVWWFFHNTFGHPCMALCQLFGAEKIAVAVHDLTLPPQYRPKTKGK